MSKIEVNYLKKTGWREEPAIIVTIESVEVALELSNQLWNLAMESASDGDRETTEIEVTAANALAKAAHEMDLDILHDMEEDGVKIGDMIITEVEDVRG